VRTTVAPSLVDDGAMNSMSSKRIRQASICRSMSILRFLPVTSRKTHKLKSSNHSALHQQTHLGKTDELINE